jgi:hypothetical protein
MKKLLTNYSISTNVVTLTGVNVPLNQVLMVSDATTGNVLYSVGGPAPVSYTQGTNSTITLATAPGSTDKLTIFYDDGVAPINPSTTVTLGGGSAAIGTVGVTSLPALPTGSNSIGSVVNNGGTVTLAAGTNSIGSVTAINPSSTSFTYSSTGAVSSGTMALASTDISAFSSVVIAASSIGSAGVISFEFSNDNSNWVLGLMSRVDQASGAYNQASALYAGAGAGAVYASPTWGFKYFRARVSTAYTAGTNTISFSFSNNPVPLQTNSVALSASPTVFPTITTGVQGFYNFHTLISSASTNVTNIITGQKNIGSLWLTNTTASLKFFKVFNATSASIGSSTPVLNLPIPPNTTTDFSTSFCSMRFGTGFTYAITGGSPLLDATAVADGDVIFNLKHL